MSDQSLLRGALEPAELQELLERQVGLTLIDVRTPAEFSAAHIPGSYNVPFDQLPEHADLLRAVSGDPVVLICRSGSRHDRRKPPCWEQTCRVSMCCRAA